MCPRKANVVDTATGEGLTVDVDPDVEVPTAAASCRRTEPDGYRVPAVVGQLPAAAAVLVRRGLEYFDVRTTMPMSVEDAQSQFVAPTTDFHLKQPAHR